MKGALSSEDVAYSERPSLANSRDTHSKVTSGEELPRQ